MTGSVFVAIDWEKEIVESITSIGLRFEYTVEQLIDQFGEPESIYGIWIGASVAAKSCADWSPSMQSEDIGRVYLIYPQKGLLFRVNVLHGGSKLLCPQMKVSAFCYFSPLSKEHEPGISDLEHLCLNNDLRDLADQYLLQWHGFGPGY